jgi:cytochrome P450
MTAAPDITTIRLDDPAIKKDPWPILHRLRDEDPVHYLTDMDAWLITRYDDIKSLFSDDRVTGDPRIWQHYVVPDEGTLTRWVDDLGLMALKGKAHARQRKLLASGFTPRGIERMQVQIDAVVKRYADALQGRTGVIDIMKNFTTPIPNAVISAITGVAASGVSDAQFSRRAQEVIQGFFGFVGEDVKKRSEESYIELSSWVREAVRLRREEPRDDLISDLVQARVGAFRFSDEDIVAQVSALVAAGSETTATGGVISVMTLLDHPEEFERIKKDRSLIPQAVNEILRYAFGGIFGTRRFVAEDFELHGRKLRKGQMLVLSLGGANHDATRFPDPERFDLDRNPQDLLTFGSGPHFCLGANLARGELVSMIDAAADFLPAGAKVVSEQIEMQSLGIFDRIMTCPVDFGSGSGS